MSSIETVYLVLNNVGELKGVFKKRENAVEAIPEGKRYFPLQVNEFRWVFGESAKWQIVENKVLDNNDLPFTGR